MLRALNVGDVLIATRLDRLARSSRDLLNTIHTINEAGAMFRSLSRAWCDTTTPHGELILTVLGGLAEFERSLIMVRPDRACPCDRRHIRPAVKLSPRQKKLVGK